MFELSILKILVLGVLALVIFGPEQLPRLASQAGRALRELRRMADGARADLQEGLGPEFRDFDLADLNPRHFVRKHLLEDLDADGQPVADPDQADPAADLGHAGPAAMTLAHGESPPYDADAT